jgi:hypothetical protein
MVRCDARPLKSQTVDVLVAGAANRASNGSARRKPIDESRYTANLRATTCAGPAGSGEVRQVTHPIKAKALRMASRKLGGNRKLRDFLRVPAEQLVRWMSGAEDPPTPILLKAIELILDDLDRRGR